MVGDTIVEEESLAFECECEAGGCESQAFGRNEDEGGSDRNHHHEIKIAARKSWAIAFLVLLMGASASAAFLFVGISSAHEHEADRFDRHARDLAKEIVFSWRDYEMAAQWIHESCRNWRQGSYSREEFRVLYNYLISGGLDFFLAEWVPNITHAERPALEAEAAAYYANDTKVDYRGFVGLEPNPQDPRQIGLFPRTDHSFYFPIQFVEPYERIGDAAHLDLYSIIYERVAIDTAIQNFVPVLTERFVIVSQETHGYSVSLIHPGVHLPQDIHAEPKDLSLLLIHIRSLLSRASRSQDGSLAVFLYDATTSIKDGSPQQFLGAANIIVEEGKEKELFYPPEGDLELVLEGADLYYQELMEVGTRTWTIVATPVGNTYDPDLFLAIFCGMMIFGASVLIASIWLMHNRERSNQVKNIINEAAAESAIVTSLFPATVRDRLIQQNASAATTHPGRNFSKDKQDQTTLKDLQTSDHTTTVDDITSMGIFGSMPIAELYPETTIILQVCRHTRLHVVVKFKTARSSFFVIGDFLPCIRYDCEGAYKIVSQSDQLFAHTPFPVLSHLFFCFNLFPQAKRIFKVETVGDCYVAAAGLPEPRKDHAAVMARFAHECLHKTRALSKALRATFGPDTANLGFRVGLHSGPVTGGVLRGQKGRFQLFGDTMNYASRMETTSFIHKVQCSQETADLLPKHWLTPRENTVDVKGKGTLQTFFVTIPRRSNSHGKNRQGFDESETDYTLSDDNVSDEDLDQAKNAAPDEAPPRPVQPVAEAVLRATPSTLQLSTPRPASPPPPDPRNDEVLQSTTTTRTMLSL